MAVGAFVQVTLGGGDRVMTSPPLSGQQLGSGVRPARLHFPHRSLGHPRITRSLQSVQRLRVIREMFPLPEDLQLIQGESGTLT